MIDVNMLPRELTGYVSHVCGGSAVILLILSLCSSIPRLASSVNCTNTWWIRFRTIR